MHVSPLCDCRAEGCSWERLGVEGRAQCGPTRRPSNPVCFPFFSEVCLHCARTARLLSRDVEEVGRYCGSSLGETGLLRQP